MGSDGQLCYGQIFSIVDLGGKYCVKIRIFFHHGL